MHCIVRVHLFTSGGFLGKQSSQELDKIASLNPNDAKAIRGA